jgi:hypothetical protein
MTLVYAFTDADSARQAEKYPQHSMLWLEINLAMATSLTSHGPHTPKIPEERNETPA